MLKRQSQLTIVIPTIGRDALKDALKSIDIKCTIQIIIDPKCNKDTVNKIFDIVRDSGHQSQILIANAPKGGPGFVKNYGIKLVSTDWFVILDDDDQFVPGYLKYAMNLLSKSMTMFDWMTTHYSQNPGKLVESHTVVYAIDFLKYYFDTERYYNRLNFIYPGSETICRTETFKNIHDNLPIFSYKYDYLDDVLPMTKFMSSTNGILHLGEGVMYGVVDSSVSHNTTPPYEYEGFKNVVADLTKILTTWRLGPNERILWKRVLTNLLDVSYFNFTFSKGANQA
jgi:glycosyltransferase involved in cell wall biosynthesis